MLSPLLTTLAFAWAVQDPFEFEYAGQTDAHGDAYLIVKANESMPAAEITVAGDGQTVKRQLPKLGAGSRFKVNWKQNGAYAKYDVTVKGKAIDHAFSFEVRKAVGGGKIGKFEVTSSREDIIDRARVTFKVPFDMMSYTFQVYNIEGDVIFEKTGKDKIKADEMLSFNWRSDDDVFMLFLRGEDEYGRFAEHKLVPWSVEIPHSEINFDSGKAIVKPGESPKIDEALAVLFHELEAIERANKAVHGTLQPKLYIVGFTDTVGPTGSNDVLSNDRAKAIAKYFYDRGVWVEIHYGGRGERALRVQTPDNFDEVRNRRALYLVALQPPSSGGDIPAHWSKLANARRKPPDFQLPALPEKWANYVEERKAKRRALQAEGDGSSQSQDDDTSTAPPREPISSTPSDSDSAGYDGSTPPPVEGQPTASSKGCNVTTEPSSFATVVLLAFAAAASRRRRA